MKIGVVVGSIREGRAGASVGNWVMSKVGELAPDVEFSMIDLKSFNVPLMTSAKLPATMNKQYGVEEVQAWSRAMDECDGFIFITPEYNHGIPGAFKNAIDWLGGELMDKTVAFISYGADNGVRATEAWRVSLANFNMRDVRAAVALSLFTEFGKDGFEPNERREGELKNLVESLVAATRR